MSLSKRALETLVDLVEIKLSCIEVYDREDSRELANLEQCRQELLAISGGAQSAPADVVAMQARRTKGRGRIRAQSA